MYIKIRENADEFFKNEYCRLLHPSEEQKRFYRILQQIKGKTIQVDTKFLFSDQFNTVPIPGISQRGIRIMERYVEKIIDDIRPGMMRCNWCGRPSKVSSICMHCGRPDYLEVFKQKR